jgi:cytohesin
MAAASDDAVRRAATSGDIRALQQFVTATGPATIRLDADPRELTTLHWAAAAGQLLVVEYLLSSAVGADPKAPRMNNFTPLHSAAMQGHAAVCAALLRAGASPNVQTVPQGYAPLHSAAFAGHVEAIRVLLAHGADPGLINYRGERPADTARRQGQIEAAKLLQADSG